MFPVIIIGFGYVDKVRSEAMRAAGECKIEEAHPVLMKSATSAEDRETFRQAVLTIAKLPMTVNEE